ncbi:MAG: PspC domain-containing protein [Patescibacteria group bacterium]
MKKYFNISLSGMVFNIEEDAFAELNNYLDSIKNHYSSDDSREILTDIESNLAEKFSARLSVAKQTITLADVEEAIKIMGTVEEFAQENTGAEAGVSSKSDSREGKSSRRLYRNPDDMIIAGVCSGLAAYFGIDPVYVRIIFIVLLFANGIGLLAYLVLWLVMPTAETNSQKLEMRGRPVNLQKLEQVVKEKTTQMAHEGKNAWQNNRKWINKILSFPIDVIRHVVMFLKKTLKIILPIISILIGVGLCLGAAGAVIGLTMVIGILLFNINSPYLISDIPLREITGTAYYYAGLAGAYLTASIPLIFLLIVSVSLMNRKNLFRLKSTILLIILWIVSLVAVTVSTLQIVPLAKDKYDQRIAQNTVSENYSFDNVNKIRVGGLTDVKVVPGDKFTVTVTGDKDALKEYKYETVDGELKITQSRKDKTFCIFCFEKRAKIVITASALDSFIAFDRVNAEVADFGKDIKVNVGESADVKVFSSSTTMTSYIAGTNGSLEVVGSPKILKAVLEGNGRLIAQELNSETIEIDAGVFSSVTLGGTVRKLQIKTSGYAEVSAFDLKTEEAVVESEDRSSVEINSLFLLDAKAGDNAEIIYLQEPKNLKRQEFQNGRVEITSAVYEETGEIFSSEDDIASSTAEESDIQIQPLQ